MVLQHFRNRRGRDRRSGDNAIKRAHAPALQPRSVCDFAPLATLGLGDLRRNVSLASLTMKVGGPVTYYVDVGTTAQMIQLVRWAPRCNCPTLCWVVAAIF